MKLGLYVGYGPPLTNHFHQWYDIYFQRRNLHTGSEKKDKKEENKGKAIPNISRCSYRNFFLQTLLL